MDMRWFRELTGIEERRQTPTPVKHCVTQVAKKGGAVNPFAVCYAQMQKSGVTKPGSQELTAKGRKVSARHAKEPKSVKKEKLARYHKVLDKLRKEHSEQSEQVIRRVMSLAGVIAEPHWSYVDPQTWTDYTEPEKGASCLDHPDFERP